MYAKNDDFSNQPKLMNFQNLAKMTMFQNLVKIDDFSNFWPKSSILSKFKNI